MNVSRPSRFRSSIAIVIPLSPAPRMIILGDAIRELMGDCQRAQSVAAMWRVRTESLRERQQAEKKNGGFVYVLNSGNSVAGSSVSRTRRSAVDEVGQGQTADWGDSRRKVTTTIRFRQRIPLQSSNRLTLRCRLYLYTRFNDSRLQIPTTRRGRRGNRSHLDNLSHRFVPRQCQQQQRRSHLDDRR